MKEISVSSLFDLNNTIAGELFEGKENAYEVLPLIHDFILKLGETLPKEKFEKKSHVLHQCQAGLQSRKEKLFHNRLCIQSYISIL